MVDKECYVCGCEINNLEFHIWSAGKISHSNPDQCKKGVTELRKDVQSYKETLEVMKDKDATAAIIAELRNKVQFQENQIRNLQKFEIKRVEELRNRLKEIMKFEQEMNHNKGSYRLMISYEDWMPIRNKITGDNNGPN